MSFNQPKGIEKALLTENTDASERYNNSQEQSYMTLVLPGFEMEDKNGLKYFGASVPLPNIEPYLAELKAHLGNKLFEEIKTTKERRDGPDIYHVTVIRPPELIAHPKLANFMQKELTGKEFVFDLGSIGSVKDGENTTYFVLVQSPEIDAIRLKANEYLKEVESQENFVPFSKHNLHTTLGFINNDVYKHELKTLDSVIIPMKKKE